MFLSVNNINVKQLQPFQQKETIQEQKDSQAEKQNSKQQISECYNNLCEYSARSMQNICDLYNENFFDKGNSFYTEHMFYCDLYESAALVLGNVYKNAKTQTANDIINAISKVKEATTNAVKGLKALIKKEQAFIQEQKKLKNLQKQKYNN